MSAVEFTRQGGLLVPADVAESGPNGPAVQLRSRLAGERALVDARREDTRARRAQDAEHRIALADVDERSAAVSRARRERARDAEETAALAALYRRAARDGERARIRADIGRSAEMRALRVALVQRVTLLAGVPILVAFGAWSTTGVQAGVARLLSLDGGSPGWWAAWVMEPALIAVVALIIIGRAVLRSSGGDTDRRADVAEWTALSMSLALNMAGGWHGSGWDALGAALAHSLGPIGAAGTAFLIGVFIDYATNARPWQGAPRLADLDLTGRPDPDPYHPADGLQQGQGPQHSAPAQADTRPGGGLGEPAPAEPVTAVREPVRPGRVTARTLTAGERVIAAHTADPDAPHERIARLAKVSVSTVKRHRPRPMTGSPSAPHAAQTPVTDTPAPIAA
ncbi:hypothetical protein ACQPYA_30045 [Micromonospora sp. CA-263727]|uniref:hypothetical protein n=1 Tax=Micromonospora sp. CA-263727 TaxID=3239967 RepID=UPI003D91AF50